MKFLAIIVLSISLLTSSSFAISLTPPQVYAIKEEKTITSTEDTKDLTSLYVYLARFFSVYITLGGVFTTIAGSCFYSGGNDKSKITIAGGIGITILGGFGIYWSF